MFALVANCGAAAAKTHVHTQGESLQDMAQIQGSLEEVASRSTWTALTNDSELQRYVPFALAGLYALLAVGT